MKMVDLFSGIGGFSLAAQWCWGPDLEIEAFVEIDSFCQKVLRKNFPGVPIYDDIKEIQWVVAESNSGRLERTNSQRRNGTNAVGNNTLVEIRPIDLLTGGFPCQPFSCAGKRAGTEDDRHLWPEMLRAIHEVKPKWVVAENVPGLLTLEDGMVFESVCADLEGEGYEVQPVIIPACAQGAPHRRDRVWIVAHAKCGGIPPRGERIISGKNRQEIGEWETNQPSGADCHAPDTDGFHGDDARHDSGEISQFKKAEVSGCDSTNSDKSGSPIREMLRRNLRPEFKAPIGNPWQEHWYEVATRLCRVDDGLPRGVDRVNRLKALGNSIVPQIALTIFNAIKEVDPGLPG
jgi:DNA (cytosine-5)-methyltransferase 1